jgi:hypothetical protein
MKFIPAFFFFLVGAAQAATITGSLRHEFSSVNGTSVQSTMTLTDGVQTLVFSNAATLLPGLGVGGCTLGAGATGQCTFDPSFTTEITPGFIFSFTSGSTGGFGSGTININAAGTPFALQQTSGSSSHANVPVTLSGTLNINVKDGNNASLASLCPWCTHSFTGTGISSGSYSYLGSNSVTYFRQVDFTLTTSEVPEPATWMSFGIAAVGLAALRLGRRR